ncbi:g13072 [Coccomyxa viridis]|uniref:G13072 protein n=1 Tax=Coccomyxa viridis TaxID=1274662 RepID=A0ABP1GBW3_9CHLO
MTEAGGRGAPHEKQPKIKLNNGKEMPMLALGTWKSEAGEVERAVQDAVRLGVRHIDTAEMYDNQDEIGSALERLFSEGVVRRQDLWVTSKLHNKNHARVREACQDTLKQLRLDYLDAYLMHWPIATDDDLNPIPGPPIEEVYHKMEELMDAGLAKSIGVSNFSVKKLRSLLKEARIKPQINQIEGHIYFRNEYNIHYCNVHGIHVTAYSPFGSPDSASMSGRKVDISYPLHDPMVIKIAEKHNKHPAQVLLRWELQRGVSTAFKAVSPEHIQSNLEALDFELPQDDMRALTTIAYTMRFVDGAKWWVRENGPIKSLTDLWDGEELTGWPPGVSTYAWLSSDKL